MLYKKVDKQKDKAESIDLQDVFEYEATQGEESLADVVDLTNTSDRPATPTDDGTPSYEESCDIVQSKPAHTSKTIRDNTVVTMLGIVVTMMTAIKPELVNVLPPPAYGIFVTVLGLLNIWRRFKTDSPIGKD